MSMSKGLQRIDNPNHDGGKGSHWVVRRGMEWAFLEGGKGEKQLATADSILESPGPMTKTDRRHGGVNPAGGHPLSADTASALFQSNDDDLQQGTSKDIDSNEESIAMEQTIDPVFDPEAMIRANETDYAAIDKFYEENNRWMGEQGYVSD